MSSVFTKPSSGSATNCSIPPVDSTEKQSYQQQQCFTASSSSSPSTLSPGLPPVPPLSVQQHYRAYSYYPSTCIPAVAKYNPQQLSVPPPPSNIRSHFFHTSGGQQAATAAVGSSLPYDNKTLSYSASQYTSSNTCSSSNYNLTNKVAATLLQLQDPVLHSLPGPPPPGSYHHPPPLKFVPGPLPHTTGVDHEGASPLEGTASPTQPTSYQSAAQFMFQTGSAFPPSPFPTHNSSPCWSHSPWPYIPFGTPTVSGASHCPTRGTGEGTQSRGGGGGGDNKINSCHVCGKTYARLSTLRSHLKSHSGEKPYQCSICQKSFTQAANLTAHLRTHSGEKPFKCPVCHRGFSQSSSVTTHMRTHSGDRPYKCNVCNKGFADSSTLTKHYRTHTGEKPYQCKICEAKFSQSGNLNRHMRTHRHHYGNGMDMRQI